MKQWDQINLTVNYSNMIYKLTFPFLSPHFEGKQNILWCHIIFISTLQNTFPTELGTFPPKTLKGEAGMFNRQELKLLSPPPLFK